MKEVTIITLLILTALPLTLTAMELDATVAISGHANDLLLDGNLLYCADRYGLCVRDVTDPQNILTRGHWGSTGLSE